MQDCETWVDMNLTGSYGMQFTTTDWKYVFREVVYGIWFWRNRLTDGMVDSLVPPEAFSKDAVKRASELQIAFDIASLWS